MIGVMGRITIAAAVLIATGFVGLGTAPAQETWGSAGASSGGSRSSSAHSAGPASGGDSHSSTAHGASPASGATSSGGSSSWTAGKESFPNAVQPGGIWRDNAAFAGSGLPSAGASAPVTHASGRPLRPAGLSPAPSAGRAAVHGKTQMAHTSGSQRPSGGSRAGAAKSSHGRPSGPAGGKSFAAHSRSRSGSRSSGSTSSSAGKGSGLSSKAPSTDQLK
jgi:hypothetical protein